jgi:hypothetical protein
MIVTAIIWQNRSIFDRPALVVAELRVLQREETGVGAYITFDQSCQSAPDRSDSRLLDFEGEIRVPGVPSGLVAVLAIDSGKLDFLELVTYGSEAWSGDTSQGEVIAEMNL